MSDKKKNLTGPVIFLVFITFTGLSSRAQIDLPRTGQTKCYSGVHPIVEIPCAFTGQDADLRTGVEWPSPRFAQNEDLTVTDRLSGLIWTPDGNIMITRDTAYDKDYISNDGAVRWQHALDYVATLNAENYLGHNDWRLPNINEMESLVNADTSDTHLWLIGNGFSNVQATKGYWSSTTFARASYAAWYVSLKSGTVLSQDKWDDACFVWPVRGGLQGYFTGIWKTGQGKCYNTQGYEIPCPGTGQDGEIRAGIEFYPRFSDNNDETVTDNLTGLMWTKSAKAPGPVNCDPENYMNWQDALLYIACLNNNHYLGYDDWRLPNRKEIRSLFNYGCFSPALVRGHPFSNVQGGFWGFYWTSTNSMLNYHQEAWATYTEDGNMLPVSKTNDYYKWAWPVRTLSPDLDIFNDSKEIHNNLMNIIVKRNPRPFQNQGETANAEMKEFSLINCSIDNNPDDDGPSQVDILVNVRPKGTKPPDPDLERLKRCFSSVIQITEDSQLNVERDVSFFRLRNNRTDTYLWILVTTPRKLNRGNAQSGKVGICVPKSAKKGLYSGTIVVSDDSFKNRITEDSFTIQVSVK